MQMGGVQFLAGSYSISSFKAPEKIDDWW
jgi:hypothetical protein